jgi:DNA-binding transcriptional ArsR family regulator
MARAAQLRVVGETPAGEIEGLALDAVFGALADPVRRRILDLLDGRELLVSEIAANFDISLQAISRHIQVLVRAGLITQERTGRIARCRFDAGPIFGATLWLNRYSKYWQGQFDLLAASLAELGGKPRRGRQKGGKTKRSKTKRGRPRQHDGLARRGKRTP